MSLKFQRELNLLGDTFFLASRDIFFVIERPFRPCTHGGENLPNNLVFWQTIPFWDANLQESGTFFAYVVEPLLQWGQKFAWKGVLFDCVYVQRVRILAYYFIDFESLLLSHLLILCWICVVVVKAFGNPGFWMYEQFWLMAWPAVLIMNTQQTPKLNWNNCGISFWIVRLEMHLYTKTYPEAQFPLALPPRFVHSPMV